MPRWNVRRYRPTDAEAVWELHVRDLSTVLPLFSEDWARDLHDVERVFFPTGDFLVGEVDGDLVTMGGFLPEDDDTARLMRVRVCPDWEDDGVVDDLIADLERSAGERGYDRIELDTNQRLEQRNRVVEARGYELVDRKPLPEWGVDILFYEKSL